LGKHQVSISQATAQMRLSINLARADRKALLLGMTSASTLLIRNRGFFGPGQD